MAAYVHSDYCHAVIGCTFTILNKCSPIPLSTNRVYKILQKILPSQDSEDNLVSTSQQNLVNFIKNHKPYFDYDCITDSVSLKSHDSWPCELEKEAMKILVEKLTHVSCIQLRNLHSYYDPERERDIFKYLRLHGKQAIESKFHSLIVKHQDTIILCGDRIVLSVFKTEVETEILVNHTGIISYAATNWGLINPWQKAVSGKVYLNKNIVEDPVEDIKDLFPLETIVNFDGVASLFMKYPWQATFVAKRNEAPLDFDLTVQSCSDLSDTCSTNSDFKSSTISLEEPIKFEKEGDMNEENTKENILVKTADDIGTTNYSGEIEVKVCHSDPDSVEFVEETQSRFGNLGNIECVEGNFIKPCDANLPDSKSTNLPENNYHSESSFTNLNDSKITKSNLIKSHGSNTAPDCLNQTDETAYLSDRIIDCTTERFPESSTEKGDDSTVIEYSGKETEFCSTDDSTEVISAQLLPSCGLIQVKSNDCEITNTTEQCINSFQAEIPEVKWKLQSISLTQFYVTSLIQLVHLIYNKLNIPLTSEESDTIPWLEWVVMKFELIVNTEEFLWNVRVWYYRHIWIQVILETVYNVCDLLEQWSPYCSSSETVLTSEKREINDESILNLAKIILEELQLTDNIKIDRKTELETNITFRGLHHNDDPVFKNATTQTNSTGSIVSTKCFGT